MTKQIIDHMSCPFMTLLQIGSKGYLWSKVYQILKSQALSCLVLLLSDPSTILVCANTVNVVLGCLIKTHITLGYISQGPHSRGYLGQSPHPRCYEKKGKC